MHGLDDGVLVAAAVPDELEARDLVATVERHREAELRHRLQRQTRRLVVRHGAPGEEERVRDQEV